MAAVAVGGERETSRFARFLGPYRVLWGERDLTLLFGGQVVSALGDWLYVTALIILVYRLTGSAAITAAVSLARLLPYAVLLPIAGVLADRWDRRTLMIVADLGRAACMVGLLAIRSRETVWLAFPLAFTGTALSSLFRPALGAIVPTVAGGGERLVGVNALLSQVDALALVLGSALAGMLTVLGQVWVAFAINAVTYAVSAGTLLLIRVPARPQEADRAGEGWFGAALVGARFLLRAQGGALGAVTMTTAGLTAFNGASWTLLVVLATQQWHLGSQGAGFLYAVYGLGGLAGGVTVGALARRYSPLVGYSSSMAVAGIAIALLGVSPAGALPFACLAAFGIVDIVNQVVGNTIIQTATPGAMLGRVFGAFEAVAVGGTLIGALVAGSLIATIGARATTVAMAGLILIMLLVALPRLRALGRPESVDEALSVGVVGLS